jgi:hypothetical protein
MKEFLLNSENNPICFTVSKKCIDLMVTALVPSSIKMVISALLRGSMVVCFYISNGFFNLEKKS